MIVAYVDDDHREQNYALSMFQQGFQHYNVSIEQFDLYKNGTAFLESWRSKHYDLIILDIYMGEISGVDVARQIREYDKEVKIVFCSSSNEFANESYNVNACYYIQKPVTEETVAHMVERLNIEDFELRKFIILPDGQKLILRNMIYAEYSNHQVEIFNKKGPALKTWISYSAFVNLLSPYDFFLSCNSGSVINLWEVTEMQKDLFVMSNSACVTISRRKKTDVKTQYQTFLLNSVRKEL